MSQSSVLGVDPGLHGAIALVGPAGAVLTWDMPIFELKGKTRIDMHGLWDLVKAIVALHEPRLAVIEEVHSMPEQGVASSFAFGRVAAAVEMALVCAGVPLHLVSPASWKRLLGLSRDKDASRAKASRLFPAASSQWARKKDDGRAEAALLAWYGSRIQ